MSKLLTMLLATVFAAVTLIPVAFAQEKKADPVAAACKGKKPGDEVTVNGKKVKCPAPRRRSNYCFFLRKGRVRALPFFLYTHGVGPPMTLP